VWVRVLVEGLMVSELEKDFPGLYRSRKFITVFTRVTHKLFLEPDESSLKMDTLAICNLTFG
jgi:hypothetical protein